MVQRMDLPGWAVRSKVFSEQTPAPSVFNSCHWGTQNNSIHTSTVLAQKRKLTQDAKTMPRSPVLSFLVTGAGRTQHCRLWGWKRLSQQW